MAHVVFMIFSPCCIRHVPYCEVSLRLVRESCARQSENVFRLDRRECKCVSLRLVRESCARQSESVSRLDRRECKWSMVPLSSISHFALDFQ